MRKIVFLLFGIGLACVANAQRIGELKGPQAKNAYAFSTVKKSVSVVTRSVPLELKGPAAKNHIRQGITRGEAYTNITRSPRMWMKGPGAKNYQPQIQKSSTNVFRKRTAEE